MSKIATKAELKKVVVVRADGERIDLGNPIWFGRPSPLHNWRAKRYRKRCKREERS